MIAFIASAVSVRQSSRGGCPGIVSPRSLARATSMIGECSGKALSAWRPAAYLLMISPVTSV